jgi:hypothetical protein
MYKKLFQYKCEECKKPRQTFKEDIANKKVCAKCIRTRVPESQMSIFDALSSVDKPVNYVGNSIITLNDINNL